MGFELPMAVVGIECRGFPCYFAWSALTLRTEKRITVATKATISVISNTSIGISLVCFILEVVRIVFVSVSI